MELVGFITRKSTVQFGTYLPNHTWRFLSVLFGDSVKW